MAQQAFPVVNDFDSNLNFRRERKLINHKWCGYAKSLLPPHVRTKAMWILINKIKNNIYIYFIFYLYFNPVVSGIQREADFFNNLYS